MGPDYISWFVDDEMVFQVSPEDYNSNYVWPFNDNQWYIILNLAITPNFLPIIKLNFLQRCKLIG